MVDRAAQDCGEFSCTQPWRKEIFTAPTTTFGQEVRLPDLVVMVHTRDRMQYSDHPAIVDSAKVGIPTIGLVDTDCNPNLITYPVPGNDDSQDSVQMFLNLVKQAIVLGKEQRKAERGQ
jgi:small subunit ribosomal protein S2